MFPKHMQHLYEPLKQVFFLFLAPNCPVAKVSVPSLLRNHHFQHEKDRSSPACIAALFLELLTQHPEQFSALMTSFSAAENQQMINPVSLFVAAVLEKVCSAFS